MKKVLTTTAFAALAAMAAEAAIIKIDGSNGISTVDFTSSATPATTYRVIDVAAVDGTAADADGVANGVFTLGDGTDEYVLDAITFVENGVFKIPAGTVIRGELQSAPDVQDAGTLVITRTARIDAQGTASDPIIFTTAAVDDVAPFGEADGLTITVLAPDTDDWFAVKSGAQWTPGATFLDADPKGSPLAPTVSFATDVAPAVPFTIVDFNTNGNPDTSTSYIETIAENRSLWGGVMISGNAPTNNARIVDAGDGTYVIRDTINGDLASNVLDEVYDGFHEGLDTVEIGERAVYGGTNPNDSSGVMRFVSIRHGGASIGGAASGGNEINGLTMGGVGRGTLIENIEVYCNGDDGYEWFGGTVDNKYLISLYNNDDSFDVDEGYTGRGQFFFSLMLDDTVNGNHGGEHDGTDAKHDSINNADVFGLVGGGDATGDDIGGGITLTYMTVYNCTSIGGGANGNTFTDSGDNNAFRIRDSWGGIYRNSVFTDFKDSIFRLDGDAYGRIDQGDVIFENNMFYGVNAPYAAVGDIYKNGSTDDLDVIAKNNTIAVDALASRRNGDPFFGVPAKFDRRGLFNGGVGFDPRADNTVSEVTSDLASYDPTFFTTVTYKGAFSPTASAANIWTGAAGSATNPAWSVFGLEVLDLQ